MFFEKGRDSLPFFRQSDNVCFKHFHRSIELLYILEGEKQVSLNGKSYTLSKNDLLVCPPYLIHQYFPSCGTQIVATIPAHYCEAFDRLCTTHTPFYPIFTIKAVN